MRTIQAGDQVQLSEEYLSHLLRYRLLSQMDLGTFTVSFSPELPLGVWRLVDEFGGFRLVHSDNLVIVTEGQAACAV